MVAHRIRLKAGVFVSPSLKRANGAVELRNASFRRPFRSTRAHEKYTEKSSGGVLERENRQEHLLLIK